ncbi:hypothetical protein C0992_011144, partial [Termitomyces sp. T32_za158]
AALVALVVVSAYKNSILNDPSVDNPVHVDEMWRILIGLGCLPGCIALYFRLTIPETPRFTMDIERNIQQATDDIKNVLTTGTSHVDPDAPIHRIKAPKASWADFCAHFGQWKNGKVLLGAAWSWFALDVSIMLKSWFLIDPACLQIAFYGLGLNSSIVLQAIGFGTPLTHGTQLIYENLKNICIGNLILSVGGLIPGFGYDKLTATAAAKKGFVVLYCFANFFQNFGPNTTTFIVPGEAFPTRYRSTAHGISAACGKLGAIVAQVGFAQMKDIGGTNQFVKHILEIFAFFMLTGIFSTFLIPETKGLSLEELSNENQENFIRA